MSKIGKSIDLYLIDGEASGRWQAKLSNWNCDAYKIQRVDLNICSDIPDVSGPGVYFLFGRDDDNNKQFVYVGEGDNCIKRIAQSHGFENDGTYWTEAVIFVTPDGTLNKAMIKYLENRFYTIAKEADRYIIKNGNTPPQSPLQRKTQDAMEEFLQNASLVMQALGHKVFESLPSGKKNNDNNSQLLYFSRKNGIGGRGIGKIEDDGFWVLKGSYINPNIASYLPAGIVKLREKYSGDIDKHGILKRDICFGSPSYASAFVCGKNSNGLVEWKNSEGVSLKDQNSGDKDSIDGKKDGIDIDAKESQSVASASGVLFELTGSIEAYMQITEEGYIVKKGSKVNPTETQSCHDNIRKRRKEMIRSGIIVDGILSCDAVFESPTSAAAVLLGRSVNGRTAWKTNDGRTLKEIQGEL